MSSDYNQLVLFDCDGGRASLFDNKTILSQLPSNCDCYLFWNNNDADLSDKINSLKSYRQIHLHPVYKSNSKNAADGKLIYFLGTLVDKYSFITIVHGGDDIFTEVTHTVHEEYGNDKISNETITHPTPTFLEQLCNKLKQSNQLHGYADPNPSHNANTDELTDKVKSTCLYCAKYCKNVEDFYQHFRDKHNFTTKLICVCELEFDNLKEFSRHQKEEYNNAINKQGVAKCLAANEPTKVYLDPYPLLLLITSSTSNKCVFCNNNNHSFDPVTLIRHLNEEHRSDTNTIRFKCCNDEKRTLYSFYYHISAQHKPIDIRKCGFLSD